MQQHGVCSTSISKTSTMLYGIEFRRLERKLRHFANSLDVAPLHVSARNCHSIIVPSNSLNSTNVHLRPPGPQGIPMTLSEDPGAIQSTILKQGSILLPSNFVTKSS